ncbi:MAG: stage 0 sporulation family protein [Clostridiales bacterium]|nr:stage 0 sporulation family protein [Clostridiales bacterium]
MVKVIGVRFKKAGKIYYFDPDQFEINAGDKVIVETARGIEYGHVVVGMKMVSEEEIVPPLKKVVRIATEKDIMHHQENVQNKKKALEICQEKIEKHDLKMKLIDVEYTFDNNKIIFYFTAEGRVDFRELVKDLAAIFKMRIELRQIGVRDEAKMLGGIGTCGKSLCCATWLGEFDPVSIKMAKVQSLSLNPTKISGICGRLMCCLKYESDTYSQLRKNLPEAGERIRTEDGVYRVVESCVLYEKVKARRILEEATDDKDEKLDADIVSFDKGSVERLDVKEDETEDIEEDIDELIPEEFKELLDE